MGGVCSEYGGKESSVLGFGGGDLSEKDHLVDPDVVGRIILRWIFRKCDVGVWTESSWFRVGKRGRHL